MLSEKSLSGRNASRGSHGSGDIGVSPRGAAPESIAASTPTARFLAASGRSANQRTEHATLWDDAAEDWGRVF